MVPFVRHLPCSSLSGDVTTASGCPKCFGNHVADGSGLGSASLCSCGYCNALISEMKQEQGGSPPVSHPSSFHCSSWTGARTACLYPKDAQGHGVRQKQEHIPLSFSLCSSLHVSQSSRYLQGRLCVRWWGAWPRDTVGWWLCASSSRTQETLV